MSGDESQTSPEIDRHYQERYREEDRLTRFQGRLEFLRTRAILARNLPPAPGALLDVGGASGAYAIPLSEDGYDVHLIDPIARHVELAKAASLAAARPLISIEQGDARDIPHADATFDGLLMLGPLYHLTTEEDRTLALREAARVLRSGGAFFGAGISRFASTLDGLANRFVMEPDFERIVERDVAEGQHRNPTDRPEWFTTAYFHHPEGLRDEIAAAGFEDVRVLAVEGPGYYIDELDAWIDDPARRAVLLRTIERVEAEPSMLGSSPHLLAVARKP